MDAETNTEQVQQPEPPATAGDNFNEDKAHLIFRFLTNPNGFERGEIPDGFGAADAAVTVFIGYEGDNIRMGIASIDGRSGENVHGNIAWMAWATLAEALYRDPQVSRGRREVCKFVVRVAEDAELMPPNAAGEQGMVH